MSYTPKMIERYPREFRKILFRRIIPTIHRVYNDKS